MLERLGESSRCRQIITRSERMTGINADAHPTLVLHPVNNIGDLLERVAEIRSLSRRVLDHRRHAAGLIQRQVDRLRNQRQTFLVADLLQRTAGVKIQSIQPQLLAALHLVEESLPRLLQRIRVRVTEINQITVVRQYLSRRVPEFLAAFFEQCDTLRRQRCRLPLPLVLRE